MCVVCVSRGVCVCVCLSADAYVCLFVAVCACVYKCMNSESVLAILTWGTAVSQVAQVSFSPGCVCRSLPHPRHPPGLSAGPRCPGAREVGALFQPVLEPQPCLEPRRDSPAGCVSARPGTWPGSRASPAGSARTGPWAFHNQPPYCPGTLASPPPLLSRPDEEKVRPGPPNC